MHIQQFAFGLFWCSGIAWANLKRQGNAITINVSPTVPSTEAPGIEADFAGFAFEESSFPAYFGKTKKNFLCVGLSNIHIGTPEKPNNLSLSLLHAITEKTKTQPVIRVGGSSLYTSVS